MERKIRLLNPDEIEVRVNQVKAKGASALLYKTARVDYEILDETFGSENWQVDYQEIKGNLYCTVSIWDEKKGQWIRKTNCGIESREDGNGNEKKGEASDAVKRAGTVVGIGRELYSSPFIWLTVPTAKDGNKYIISNGTDKEGKPIPSFDKYEVAEIGYDAKRRINALRIVNSRTKETVYTFGIGTTQNAKQAAKTADKAKSKAEPKAETTATDAVPPVEQPVYDFKAAYMAFVQKHGLTQEQFFEWKKKAAADPETHVPSKSLKNFTPDEWRDMLGTMDMLAKAGFFEIVA